MTRLVANGPGLGDAVVLTAVVRALAERDAAEPVVVSSEWPGVFAGHPNVVATERWDASARSFPELDTHRRGEHQIALMLRKLGLPIPRSEDLVPTVLASGPLPDLPPGFVTISTTPGAWTRNKDWLHDDWEATAIVLGGIGPVVQIGGPGDRRLSNASHFVLGEPVEVVATTLRASRLHVAPVTGTMHLATAVGTKVVAIFGGRENPAITGYARNVNVTRTPSCAPCWLVEPCPYAREIASGESVRPCSVEFVDAVKGIALAIEEERR